jgi:hypothetical protein
MKAILFCLFVSACAVVRVVVSGGGGPTVDARGDGSRVFFARAADQGA